jgi:hypothetical protein
LSPLQTGDTNSEENYFKANQGVGMNIKRVDGALLDFWVAKAAGLKMLPRDTLPGELHDPESGNWHPSNFHPSSDWSHGGALVASEWYAIEDMLIEWFGPHWPTAKAIADHPLPWFMRAYVATQFGDHVEEIGSENSYLAPSIVRLAQLQLNTLRSHRAEN